MANCCVEGDKFQHPQGGADTLVPSQSFFTINGKAVLVDGDQTKTHVDSGGNMHVGRVTGTGFLTVGGKRAVMNGDSIDCSASMIEANGISVG